MRRDQKSKFDVAALVALVLLLGGGLAVFASFMEESPVL